MFANLTWVGMLGSGAITLATAFALGSLVTAWRDVAKWPARFLQLSAAMFGFALTALAILFINGEFQFRYVFRHSALDHDLKFRIAGVWSGQEGSFLLWAVCSGLFLALCVARADGYQRWFAGVGSAFLAALGGILMFESPFVLNPSTVNIADGLGMPPTLMNYWVVIHPPVIFLGFGLLTSLFAWACAAMGTRNFSGYLDQIRPWSMLALTLLGVGLSMGGFWAYETLGWGGFWMWDPVENTSFVPFILVTAFIHGIFVQKARGKWHLANAIMAGAPFLAFGYGTFLTRSGFLGDTSVHSFAQMDRTALYILVGLVGTALAGFIWLSVRAARWLKSEYGSDSKEPRAPFFTKEVLYLYGNWFLIFLGLITGFGMSVPLIQSLSGQAPKVVEEPLYNTLATFAFIPIVLLMAISPILTWRKRGWSEVGTTYMNAFAASISVAGFLLLWLKWGGETVAFGPVAVKFAGQMGDLEKTTTMLFGAFQVPTTGWVVFLTTLCAFAIFTNLAKAWQMFRKHPASTGGMLTHIGVILAVAGLIVSRGLEQKVEGVVHESKTEQAFGYDVNLKGPTAMLDNRDNKIEVSFSGPNGNFVADPGLYFLPGQDGSPQPFLTPDIHSWPLYDVYTVVHPFFIDNETGEVDFGGSEPVRVLPGQSAEFNGVLLQYRGYRVEGTPGTLGAKFIADVHVTGPGVQMVANPSVQVNGPNNLDRPAVDLGRGLGLMLDGIDPADQSARLVIKYLTPAYPIEIYYKPLTGLVWWGIGILAFGGLVTAYYRRRPKALPPGPSHEQAPAAESQKERDATAHPVEV